MAHLVGNECEMRLLPTGCARCLSWLVWWVANFFYRKRGYFSWQNVTRFMDNILHRGVRSFYSMACFQAPFGGAGFSHQRLGSTKHQLLTERRSACIYPISFFMLLDTKPAAYPRNAKRKSAQRILQSFKHVWCRNDNPVCMCPMDPSTS